MITPILEKLLLTGKAKNKIHHLAWGMFSQLIVPDDSFIVIHKIYWHNFLNQKNENIFNMTWKQFFSDCEYQLKVKPDKDQPIYYIMRNELNFQYFNNFDPANALKLLNQPITDTIYDDYILMQPKKPNIFDTWITAYDSLNFTISRNSLEPGGVNFGILNQYANENPNPYGVDGSLVTLDVKLIGSNGNSQFYTPPNNKTTHPPLGTIDPTNTENYFQSLDKQAPPNNGSYINNPLSVQRLKYSHFVTNPLLSFEYVEVRKNSMGNI